MYSYSIISIVLMILAAALYIALAYLLVRIYLRSRNKGYIWLGIALLIWPSVQTMLTIFERHFALKWITGSRPTWFWSIGLTPGTFLSYTAMTQHIILLALLLIAVYYLGLDKIEPREFLA